MPELPDHLRRRPMAAEQVSREVLAEHQRARVLKLVTPIFAKRGYQGTSVDDLLAAGKVGVSNFYSLFEGKEDCFLETFESIVDFARGRVADAAAPAERWAEAACLGLREMLGLVVSDQRAARVVLIEAQAAGPEATRRYEALLDDATAWLHAGRVELAAEEALPFAFERSVIAGLAYYLQQCLLSGSIPEPDELFTEVSSVVLAPVIGGEELRRLRGALASA